MKLLLWIYSTALVLLLFCLSIAKIDETDTMQYLANGRLLISYGFHANFCSFNYTVHTCIINYMHEWFFGTILYFTYLIGQWNGLVALQVILIITIFFLLVLASRKWGYSFFSTGFFLFLTMLIGWSRFILRADVFGILFVILFYTILRVYIDKKLYAKKGLPRFFPVFSLAVIEIGWVNSHGSFFLSFLILGIFLLKGIGDMLKDVWQHKSKISLLSPYLKVILMLLVITTIASLFNPFGIRSLLEGFNYGAVISPYIEEWQSPFMANNFHHFADTIFILLIFISSILLLFNYKRLRFTDVCLFMIFLASAIRSNRNIFLFAIWCTMILPYYLDATIGSFEKYLKRKKNAQQVVNVVKAVIAVTVVMLSFFYMRQAITGQMYIMDHRNRRFGIGLSENTFPIGAANFIEKNNLSGNMFNDYAIGTYLNWRLYPRRKTFIDGLTFSLQSVENYHKIITGETDYNKVARQYNINFFILNTWNNETQHLIKTLYHDKKWVLVYLDEISCIFIANKPENHGIINQFAINFSTNQNFDQNQLPTFADFSNIAYGFILRGLFLENIGIPKQANYQFQKAVSFHTGDGQAYSGLGITYAQLGKLNLSLQPLKKAAELDPRFAPNHFNLGYYYFISHMYGDALDEFEKTLQLNSSYLGANFFIGLIYKQQGNLLNAKVYFQQETITNPQSEFAKQALEASLQ